MEFYQADLDGFPLDVESADDTFEWSIVRHEFPGIDGAALENLGQKARTVRLPCWFWDDETHLSYDNHTALLDYLLNRTATSYLTHPAYGRIQGYVERVSVRHDDQARTCRIDLDFVEYGRQAFGGERSPDVASDADAAIMTGIPQQVAGITAAAVAEIGVEAYGILDQVLDPAKTLLEQFTGISATARKWVTKVQNDLARLEATITTVANPANSLIATITFTETIPGRIMAAVNYCAERYVTLINTGLAAPANMIDLLDYEFQRLEATLEVLGTPFYIAGTYQSGGLLAANLDVDEQCRQAYRSAEQTPAWTLDGRYVGAPLPALLTVNAIEAALARINTMIQRCIDQDRTQTALKTLAETLTAHVKITKLEMDRIVTVTPDTPLPLHLLCLGRGLPYPYAERIVTLNPHLANPNAIDSAVLIYARHR